MEVVPNLRRSLAALTFAAAAVGLASAAYQMRGSRRDRHRLPPPGEMVDIGGRHIHLWWAGTGTPSIVIVPALGTASIDFAGLLPQLSQETTAVIFDRAGLGWSESAPGPAGLLAAHHDLHAALHRADIEPPYVLVGHSIGGYIVRRFAAAHPDEVAGVVLLDSSHHDQMHRLPGYPAKVYEYALRWRLRPYGFDRLASDLGIVDVRAKQAVRRYPAEYADAGVALAFSDRQRRTDVWEVLAWTRLAAETGRLAPSLGSIPLTVVSSSELSPDYVTPEQVDKRRADYKIWYPMQVELAGLSTDSKHVVAENAGHYVHRFQPELVAEAILDQVERARSRP